VAGGSCGGGELPGPDAADGAAPGARDEVDAGAADAAIPDAPSVDAPADDMSPTAPATPLARGGVALFPVIVHPAASSRIKDAARILVDYLGRIVGAPFSMLEKDDARSGIVVGLSTDFSAWSFGGTLDPNAVERQDEYVLRAHAAGVHLAGASEHAVEHAVWDLLERCGYRQFFPGERWEIVPTDPDLAIAVDRHAVPAYRSRRIWYGYGTWDVNRPAYERWSARNRTGGFIISTGHAYQAIIAAHQAEFDAHPEYLAEEESGTKSTKFCVSEPGLQAIAIQYAIDQLTKNPDQRSVSMEPSDGGGWDGCPKDATLGSVSNRVVTLANAVAVAINDRFGERYVGIYAYNEHAAPPTIPVHPRVFVSVATAYAKGGYTIDEVITGWKARGATIGIREYYAIHPWDRDLPGQARASSPEYVARTIARFHEQGARSISAESSDAWGPVGLGHWIAAKLFWDAAGPRAPTVDTLTADFLDRAFSGGARASMSDFYQLIDGDNQPLLSEDLVGRMYRKLDQALRSTADPAVRARVEDLILYTRYVDLFRAYSTAAGAARQAAFETVVRYGYRIRRSGMIHSLALYRDVDMRDGAVSIPVGAGYTVPEPQNPWKSSEPVTAREIETWLIDGIARNGLLSFEPRSFSDDLVPAPALASASGARGSFNYVRDGQSFYTWVAAAPATVSLQASGGIARTDLGETTVTLFPLADPLDRPAAAATVPADKISRDVALRTTHSGLHRVEVADNNAGARLSWSAGTPMTIPSGSAAPANLQGRWTLYFYVPKGTTVVGGFASGGDGTLETADGALVLDFAGRPAGYFSVAVAAGQAGRLWRFHNTLGQRFLMTVPPQLALSPAELLLPAEVVAADKLARPGRSPARLPREDRGMSAFKVQ